MLVEIKLKTSTSFRAVALNAMIIAQSLNLESKSPSHTTILNWIHKIGYYQLKIKKEKSDDWIIMIDESIQVGKEKILLIIGIKEKDVDFSRPLVLQDMLPLREEVHRSMTGEQISAVLSDLKKELGDIKYAVSDGGSNIKKGLRLSGITHIYDLTHRISMILEKKYNTNDNYVKLLELISGLKTKYVQTDLAFLMPPKLRNKSRYINMFEVSRWLLNTLKYYENNKENDICKKLEWIYEYKDFIHELNTSIEDIKEIEKTLKTNGYSKETENKCFEIMYKNKSGLGEILRNDLTDYFHELSEKLDNTNKIVITSDIIESAFGKYKNYLSENTMAGITNLILCISAFTFRLEESRIKTALESISINDIKKWTKETIGKSLFQARKEAYVN